MSSNSIYDFPFSVVSVDETHPCWDVYVFHCNACGCEFSHKDYHTGELDPVCPRCESQSGSGFSARVTVVLALFLPLVLGCASSVNSHLRIGYVGGDIIVRELGSSNSIWQGQSTAISGDTALPVSGVPVPISGQFMGTGMFNKLAVDIETVSGSIRVRRDLTGNLGVDIVDALKYYKNDKPEEWETDDGS